MALRCTHPVSSLKTGHREHELADTKKDFPLRSCLGVGCGAESEKGEMILKVLEGNLILSITQQESWEFISAFVLVIEEFSSKDLILAGE